MLESDELGGGPGGDIFSGLPPLPETEVEQLQVEQLLQAEQSDQQLASMAEEAAEALPLEELLARMEAASGRLQDPNHADADVLLREWANPRVAALVPTLVGNKIPPDGGTFFQSRGARTTVNQAGQDWLPFQTNGGPSLSFRTKRSHEDEDVLCACRPARSCPYPSRRASVFRFRSPQNSDEGVARYGCSLTKKASGDDVPLRIMRFQVVALPGHSAFPPLLVADEHRSSSCTEAKVGPLLPPLPPPASQWQARLCCRRCLQKRDTSSQYPTLPSTCCTRSREAYHRLCGRRTSSSASRRS